METMSNALQAGFRHVWSSAILGSSCQVAQGEALRASGIDRAELFIVGTVNSGGEGCTGFGTCYEQTMSGAQEQFQSLGFDTLDMIMLNYPTGAGCQSIAGQWEAFEELYAKERVRAIAVSNFSPEQIECITANASATVPSVNRLHYSIGDAGTVIEDNARHGIFVQSYSPLSSHGKAAALIIDSDCKSIGQRHGKTAPQVALKWILQTNGTVAMQSINLTHLQEDIDIFDFELTEEELGTLNAKSLQDQQLADVLV